MTPPPGSAGGLLNAIMGSLVLTALAVLIGTPIGILAGTYMAEYGRHDRLTSVVRFINDILLSAPSIVIGLFIYEVMVYPMGHFSGWAGAVALAVIVIPVVVRTTEDMLTLVPDTLREAAASIGLPRSLMITRIAYRAAKAGMVTGVLLAVARISGETAPLLFTALNNQFWSTNLNAPMASLPVVIFQFALSPYKDWQALAWTGALIITLAVLALSIVARALSATEKTVMNVATMTSTTPTVTHAPVDTAGLDRADLDPRPQLLLRRQPGAEGHHAAALRRQGHGLHRPVRLRQVHAAARPQPDVRPLSEPARRGRGDARRRGHPVAQAGPQPAARAHRHGVPEADAVPDVDLREHRLRHPALREAAEVRARRPGRDRAASAPRCGTRSRTSSAPTA